MASFIALTDLVREPVEANVLNDILANRVIKKLIAPALNPEAEMYTSMLANKLKGNMLYWAKKKGANFIVCNLLENASTQKKVYSCDGQS